MGMIANYMACDDKALEKIMNTSEEDLIDEIEELDEQGVEVCDIDKMWDGLHFLLTGVSASQPIEGTPLSEAIVGVRMFDDEGEDFISYSKSDEVQQIVNAIKNADINKLIENADIEEFHKNDIYPNIWDSEDAEELKQELSDAMNQLKDFYQNTLADKLNVVVSIY